MHPSLSETRHRPWPLPEAPWRWRQTWSNLAFLHYRVNADSIASWLPSELMLESFDGSAWVSVVPFMMEDVAPRSLPSPPPLNSFQELNLRTYVTDGRKAGVWFFSLDADCTPMVLGGRGLYGLPYYRANIDHQISDGVHSFSSRRWSKGVRFEARYAARGPLFSASPGSFEHWVTERYCLYSARRGALICVDVHHQQWPLQPAEVEVRACDLFQAAAIQQSGEPPICHYSPGVAVISFSPERVPGRTRS